jgi:hypothetical protein
MIMMMNWTNKKFELIFEFDARNKYFRFIFNNLAVLSYYSLLVTQPSISLHSSGMFVIQLCHFVDLKALS